MKAQNNLLTTTELAIINIIADHVVFRRMEEGLMAIASAYNPTEGADVTILHYGIQSALLLMETDNEELNAELADIFYDTVCARTEVRNARDLAECIYYQWLLAIKNYFLNNQTA